MQMAYVDFEVDCYRHRRFFRQSAETETSRMQPHSQAYGSDGGPGGIAFSDSAPGGFRFLSPCRKEQRDYIKLFGNVNATNLCP